MAQAKRTTQAKPTRARAAALLAALMLLSLYASQALAQDGNATPPAEEKKEEAKPAEGEAKPEEKKDEAKPAEGEAKPAEGEAKPAEEEEKEDPRALVWFPGWGVGVGGSWIFANLDDVNAQALDPNGVANIDASGIVNLELRGDLYLTQRFLIGAEVGYSATAGGETSHDLTWFGIEPAVVFPQRSFQLLLGVRLGYGSFGFSGDSAAASDVGYEGGSLLVEPSLTLRYLATNYFAADLRFGFRQFLPTSVDEVGGAVSLDTVPGNRVEEEPLAYAGPLLGLGFYFGDFRDLRTDFDQDEDGVRDSKDKCIEEPEDKDEYQDKDGCPDPDNDSDGFLDAADKCPVEAEDKDGFQDDDGCADPDNDGDKILDKDDQCPNEAEEVDGFKDEDGCPDPDNDGDGFLDAADKCPVEAEDKDGFQDDDGCLDPDNDGDGIVDPLDKCDNDAEDKDGFEDGDGCPDPDNDKDGVLDAQDKCPNEKETLNGVDDTDGCPDQGKVLVEVKAEEIKILQQVNFDTGKATIKADSFNILKVVAQVLKSNPQVKKIEIQGHTDDVGGDAGNLTLSEGRANSVRDFLIKEGVQPERLVAKGYGETKPLVSLEGLKEKKQLDGARALNRRVQFIILEQPKPE